MDKCIWGVLDDIILGAPDKAPRIAPKYALQSLCKDARKGALQPAYELHLFM